MGQKSQEPKRAVILFNLGGPKSLHEVKPFLKSLFSDPAILTIPQPFRYLLSHWIARRRTPEAQHIYKAMGGGSPLLQNTEAQACALSKELGKGYKVFVCMRHTSPQAHEVIKKVIAYAPSEVILLPLYPQYSTTTTGSAFKVWNKTTRGQNWLTKTINHYPRDEGFIEAMTQLFLPIFDQVTPFGKPRILLTAHGLPEKLIKKGDPYQHHIEQTADALVGSIHSSLSNTDLDYILCYQSRVGPLKWTSPYTENEVLKAAKLGRPIIMVPLSFVSEHSETLYELDRLYEVLALDHGCPAYFRVPTVSCHPAFINGLASLIRKESDYAC